MINHVFEDFAKRKKIDAKNCFLPNKKLTFFVNCNQKSTWHLVEIFWKLITGHPSYFVVNLKSSKFNSLVTLFVNFLCKAFNKPPSIILDEHSIISFGGALANQP